jgi:hypothetical protein
MRCKARPTPQRRGSRAREQSMGLSRAATPAVFCRERPGLTIVAPTAQSFGFASTFETIPSS